MIVPIKIPNGYEELVAWFGDPDANKDGEPDIEWKMKNLATFRLPQPMRVSWGNHYFVDRIWAHKLVGASIVDALDEVFNSVGVEEMRERTWDYLGGCYNFRRNTNSPDRLSVHSWGAAIDLNPHLAPNGEVECRQPGVIVQAFVRRGWIWAAKDYMHTQAVINY